MREHKMWYMLALVIVIGASVTLCTRYLTGGTDGAARGVSASGTGTAGEKTADMSAAGAGNARKSESSAAAVPIAVTTAAGRPEGPAVAAADGAARGVSESPDGDGAAAGARTAEEGNPGDGGSAGGAGDGGSAGDGAASGDAEPAARMRSAGEDGPAAGTVAITPVETAPVKKAEEAADEDGPEQEESSTENPYLIRLQELDAQIRKNRDSQGTAAAGAVLSREAASGELKLWETELNAIYDAAADRLDDRKTEELIAGQREWLKKRDAAAVEAAKNSAGGSRESVEYTVSLTESTRARAYELAETYGNVLSAP